MTDGPEHPSVEDPDDGKNRSAEQRARKRNAQDDKEDPATDVGNGVGDLGEQPHAHRRRTQRSHCRTDQSPAPDGALRHGHVISHRLDR